ncbi:MAG: ATP/GTP-binding protein [Chloroflexi bacterium]|nr:ATP/GTP-binding protein [Chloroflexota bacterium]
MSAIPDTERQRLGRLITLLHDRPEQADDLLAREGLGAVQPTAHTVGISGAPGSGKSTLISRVIPLLRQEGLRVAVLAIDPTSERSGGALLGDRVRMRDSYLDPGVFIRSLATRGAPEALTRGLPAILRATGTYSDVVLVETAGAGQVDVGIHRLVDTFVVVLAPLGDVITLMKAGQTEHAHVIAINVRKGLPESDRFAQEARLLLGRDSAQPGWDRKVFPVDAKANEGVEAFVREGLLAHRDFLRRRPA